MATIIYDRWAFRKAAEVPCPTVAPMGRRISARSPPLLEQVSAAASAARIH